MTGKSLFVDMCDCMEGDYEELTLEVEDKEPEEIAIPIKVRQVKK